MMFSASLGYFRALKYRGWQQTNPQDEIHDVMKGKSPIKPNNFQ
jgi:hypothetical protein